MNKKLIVALAALALLSGCAQGSFPSFPEEITEHFLVEVKEEGTPDVALYNVDPHVLEAIENLDAIEPMAVTEVARCIKFKVVSKIPYKISFDAVVALKECHGVGGFKPSNFVKLTNWISDVKSWADTRKKCFK